jgi:hypothetical protein
MKTKKVFNHPLVWVPVLILAAPSVAIIFVFLLTLGIFHILGDLIMKSTENKKGLVVLFGILSGMVAFVAPFLAIIPVTLSFWSLPFVSAVSISVAAGGVAAAVAAGLKGLLVWASVVALGALVWYGWKKYQTWSTRRKGFTMNL